MCRIAAVLFCFFKTCGSSHFVFFFSVMIQSLQIPILNLMREAAQSLNNTHYNFSEVLEKFQVAIESTVRAAQQVSVLERMLFRLAVSFVQVSP